MSSSRLASIASAQAAARSLARSGNAPMRSRSDCDIDLAAPFDDIVLLQAMPVVDDMAAVFQMKLPAMPRADDVHVGFVEILTEENALLADLLDDLRHLQALAGRSALVRADIAIGVIGALGKDHADLDGPALHQAGAAFGDLAFLAHADFGHGLLPLTIRALIIRYLMIGSTLPMGLFQRGRR